MLSPNGETQLLNKSFIGLFIYSLIVLMILNNIRKPINKCLYILVRDNVAIYSVSNNLLKSDTTGIQPILIASNKAIGKPSLREGARNTLHEAMISAAFC